MIETQVPDQGYNLRLYVAGQTPKSIAAIANLRKLCDQYLAGAYDLEVIDLYQQPELAAEHQLVAAPALFKLLPLPPRKMVGDMSDTGRVLAGLGISS